MFKNREIRIRVAKTNKEAEVPTVEAAPWSPGNVAEAASEYTKTSAKTIIGATAAIIVLKAACEIAVNYAPKN